MTASAPARLGTIVAPLAVVLGAVLAVLVAVRLDLGCSSDASDTIQNVACDPRTGALDVLRVALLVLAPLAALGGAVCAFVRGGRRALMLGGGLALVLVMAAGDVGGAMTPEERVPRIEGLSAERSGGSLVVELSLTREALVLLDLGSMDRRPRSVSENGRPVDPRVAGGFGPGYLLGPGSHRLTLAAPAGARMVRAEAILPGAGNQRDRSRGVVRVHVVTAQ
ncbi:MAG TPA: hypothetical protein VFD31_04415 [Thermoleophilaceae bacterium]|nr:hypothetical protein [Thermoleophilaceae bacterium]